ncbi:MAG: hypothetical protein OMM_06770 [Candidatus Magnetoglobus multicellularis str. Araruama]|uniref:Transcriptional coactivator p15 (PC4) C-terminal domain-containing protein n=1 Tax=Candidatus Magnetoglobus multicellularis str. Araruama TaxID=890399 RepID=A0A1V1PFQ5_9BACT|nr:MAG: hypothetical protein OMM_06770 [Candidatus Magnetoglobus multicellularis str. Araruama]
MEDIIMAENIDDITIKYEEDDKIIVDELDKEILSKGAWTTIIFKFRQWDNKLDDYGPDKFTIRRYRKMKGEYKQQSKFNISSKDQAEKIVATLQKWI